MDKKICKRILKSLWLVFFVTLVFSVSNAFAIQVELNPMMDNTVAEDFPDNSSGECESIFSGNTDGFFARRALMQFDIFNSIPAGSTINSVSLSMTITRGGGNADSNMSLHRINATWVEGAEGCGVRGGGQGEPSTGGVTWNTMPAFDEAASGTTPIVGADPPVSVDPRRRLHLLPLRGQSAVPGTRTGLQSR